MPPLKKPSLITNAKPASHNAGRNNKSESEPYLSVCNVCGQKHETNGCQFLQELHYVKDEPLLSRARQTLPRTLEITTMADGSTTVVAKCHFQPGTSFGPLQAKRDRTMNPMTNFPIKVFGNGPTETYHLDYSNEDTSNWMCFVSPASSAKEQNLVCFQVQQDIFYTAMRAISAGDELRVWYAPYYALRMNMPLFNSEFANVDANFSLPEVEETMMQIEDCKKERAQLLNNNIRDLAERLPAENLGARGDKTSWNCRICSIVITSVIAYAKHLMEHYKPLLGVFCDICNKKFHRISVLQKHKRVKHPEGIASSDVVGIPTSENQLQQNAQTILLNMSDADGQTSEAMKDILEKFKAGKSITESNLLLPLMETEKENQSELPLLDTNSINVNDLLQNNATLMENSSLKSILENQCLNMNLGLGNMTDSILSETIPGVDSVKFNVEELASELLDITPDVENINRRVDNLECDICKKNFEKVDYLYRHLRKHTGEFICPVCLTVFARKENLVSHACPSQNIEHRNYVCLYCQKPFVLKKYLKRHMVKHTEWNTCKWCHNLFSSHAELEAHKCQAPKHVCSECGKRFVHRAHLNRHAKSHADPKPAPKRIRKKRIAKSKPVICEKCGDVFKNCDSLKQHLRSHGERKFECDVCHSRFHRIGVLKQHKAIHQSVQIPCHVCGKKLKSKKALGVHVLLHGNKKFQCEKCDKSFFQRCNYLKHYKQIHSDKVTHKCPHCPTQFTSEVSFNKHVESHVKPAQHNCSSCHKVFHREYQLKRHVQTNHSGIIFRCPYCKMTARYRHSMRRHFERQHKSLSEEWDKPGFVNDLIEKTTATVLIEQVVPKHEESGGLQVAFEDANPVESQGLIISVTGMRENQLSDETQVPAQENVDEIGRSSLNGQEVLLRVSETDQTGSAIEATDLRSSEVPQLSISDTDAHLAESVLGNAYIFGDDGGDIMFYVLDNTPVITEY